MASRPAIPEATKRKVLLESRHRCAVCGKEAALELAHIVPWFKSKSHEAENLICLCAICHTRADSEKWGKKALEDYKHRPWILYHLDGRPEASKICEHGAESRNEDLAGCSRELPPIEADCVAETLAKLSKKGMVNGQDWSINLSVTATGLGSVLDFIAEAARATPREISVVIDRRGIEDAGVSLDDPVDLELQSVSVEQALRWILPVELGYVIAEDGAVLISSKEAWSRILTAKNYSVGDLTGTEKQQVVGQCRFEQLRSFLERTVHSEEPWDTQGGRAAITFFKPTGTMTVMQTLWGHEQVQQQLVTLRRDHRHL